MLLRVKILGAIIALLGIGMFALPTGILASGFAEEIQRRRGGRRNCPHCGMDIDKTQKHRIIANKMLRTFESLSKLLEFFICKKLYSINWLFIS
jgi:hypothetical protein